MTTRTSEDRYLASEVEDFTRDMYNMLRTTSGYIIRAQGWKNSMYASKFFNQIKKVKACLEEAEKFKV